MSVLLLEKLKIQNTKSSSSKNPLGLKAQAELETKHENGYGLTQHSFTDKKSITAGIKSSYIFKPKAKF